ncbi:hypothetical protein [Gimesia maris]|uniref:hypothetical protein n=1 Tax=Gimesia maris TaxID=122 RepID=UPI0032EF8E33
MEVAEHFDIDEITLVQLEAATVQDLIRNIMMLREVQTPESPAELLSRPEIQSAVVTIISRVTGQPPTEITLDDRLIDLCD